MPLGLPEKPTDEIAVDAYALSKYLGIAKRRDAVPVLTGDAAIEGSKKVISTLGRAWASGVALIQLGAAILWWRSESGGRFPRVHESGWT